MYKTIMIAVLISLFSNSIIIAQSTPNFKPGEFNQSESYSTLLNHFHTYVDEGVLSGTSILIYQNEKAVRDLYGYQDIENQIPIQEETIFRIASMTKPITSVAIFILVEEGKIKLDDPVEYYIPEFKDLKVYKTESEFEHPKQKPTIRHLLSHTGGLTSGFDTSPAGTICVQMMKEKSPKTLDEIVAVVSNAPLAFDPGEGWAYSYSTDVLAYIIQEVSNIPFEQFIQERIFDPLKMESTGYQIQADKLDRLANLYRTNDSGILEEISTNIKSRYTKGGNIVRGSGGLTSTINDYFRFTKMIFNGGELDGIRIIESKHIELMRTNLLTSNHGPVKLSGQEIPGWGFGLGFGVLKQNTSVGTPGDYFWPGSVFTYFFISPEHNAIGLFMTQLSDMRKMSLIFEFHSLASEAFKIGL